MSSYDDQLAERVRQLERRVEGLERQLLALLKDMSAAWGANARAWRRVGIALIFTAAMGMIAAAASLYNIR